jgi:hypothetical protein
MFSISSFTIVPIDRSFSIAMAIISFIRAKCEPRIHYLLNAREATYTIPLEDHLPQSSGLSPSAMIDCAKSRPSQSKRM